MQSFPLTLNRVPGSDFRLPTDAELDALEAFQLFLGRDVDIDLAAINFKSPVVARGRDLFNTTSSGGGVVAAGKCNLCHLNAGASFALGPPGQNRNFNTGVENLPDQPADLIDPTNNPPDDGFGNSPDPLVNPAVGTFNTPPVVEAADTGPHFHNNSVDTIEAAVGFYNGDTFANSPAGNFLAALDGGVAIDLEATQVVAIAALLRVLMHWKTSAAPRSSWRSSSRTSATMTTMMTTMMVTIPGPRGPSSHSRLQRSMTRSRSWIVVGCTRGPSRISEQLKSF